MKLLLVLLLTVALVLAYIRLAPSDAARWHVDPAEASDPGAGGVLMRHAMDVPPDAAMRSFDEVASEAPRTRLLAGSVAAGHVTYVSRTKWIGFPDYITVKAVAAESGSDLVILSRLRFGRSDLGVNRVRLEDWLQRLETVQN